MPKLDQFLAPLTRTFPRDDFSVHELTGRVDFKPDAFLSVALATEGEFLCQADPGDPVFQAWASLWRKPGPAPAPESVQAAIRGLEIGFQLGVAAARAQIEGLMGALRGEGVIAGLERCSPTSPPHPYAPAAD